VDSDDLTEVYWFFVPDSAPALPFSHQFGHWIWSRNQEVPNPGDGEVGELLGSPASSWYDGRPPVFTSTPTTYCGDIDTWQNGATESTPPIEYSVNGIAPCCYGGGGIDFHFGGIVFGVAKPPSGLVFGGNNTTINWGTVPWGGIKLGGCLYCTGVIGTIFSDA
jgi:hypothetical protein